MYKRTHQSRRRKVFKDNGGYPSAKDIYGSSHPKTPQPTAEEYLTRSAELRKERERSGKKTSSQEKKRIKRDANTMFGQPIR